MADPRYPITVELPGGRVRHAARLIGDGPAVNTLCRKRGTPTGDGSALPYCRACDHQPNPINQRSYASRLPAPSIRHIPTPQGEAR